MLDYFKRIVSGYLFTPIKKTEAFKMPYKVINLHYEKQASAIPIIEPTSAQKPLSPEQAASNRTNYTLQGVQLGEVAVCKRVLVFIKGMGNHLFFNNRRFEETMASMGQHCIGYSANPFGVINHVKNMRPFFYKAKSIMLDDVVDDYKCFIEAVMSKHPEARLTLVGHSAGGVFAKLAAKRLMLTPLRERIDCIYSAASFNSITGFIDKMTIAEMLGPKRAKLAYRLLGLLDVVNTLSFGSVKYGIKAALHKSGWADTTEEIESVLPKGRFWQSNIMPQYDDMIGTLASVIEESKFGKILMPIDNSVSSAHGMAPSQLMLANGQTEQLFIKKIMRQCFDRLD